MTRRALLAATCAAVAVLPVAPAVAQPAPSTLPDGSLSTVSEAGGRLFWVTPSAGAKISLYGRPMRRHQAGAENIGQPLARFAQQAQTFAPDGVGSGLHALSAAQK